MTEESPTGVRPACSSKERAIAPLLASWAEGQGRSFPWRGSGTTPFQVLVAELLLKRTTAQAAARVYGQFLGEYPHLAAIVGADTPDIEKALESVGLQRQRARGFKAMANFIVDRYAGAIPTDLDSLLEVPQIGEYTARAVMSFGHGIPAAVVDSNVIRVLGRLFSQTLGKGPTLAQLQKLADALLPEQGHQKFNWAVLDLGALVCRYDRPKCEICPLMAICDTNQLPDQRFMKS